MIVNGNEIDENQQEAWGYRGLSKEAGIQDGSANATKPRNMPMEQ